MIIVPLGVGSATPTVTRHLSSTALWREGRVYLFDCGEHTQMRMLQGGLKRSRIDCIFISHFDTDHYSGLIGLLSTLQLQQREDPIKLVGPKGLQKFIEWNFEFADVNLRYEIRYVELEEGFEEERVVDEEGFYVEALPLNHSSFCIGYRFQEKDQPGKVDAEKAQELGVSEDWQYKELKAGNDVDLEDGSVVKSIDIVGHPRPGDSFAYVTDTKYCPNSVKLAMNTSVLMHEATFSNEMAEKAEETGHSTTGIAARVANESKTKLLVITHFSARFTNAFILLKEARKDFFPTWLATELRPIFTDPAHERGIVQTRAYVKEVNKHKKYHSNKHKKKKKRFKRGRKVQKQSSESDYENDSRKRRPKQSSDSSDRDNNNNNNNNSNSNGERKPKPITPRSPFDDFNRF
jgi:ribonuclease Z